MNIFIMGDTMNKNKIIYATSNFIFFLPLFFNKLDKRKKYANQGLLILLSWFICYLISLFLGFIGLFWLSKTLDIISYIYPLYLAIKGAYMVYMEKELR